MNNEFGLKGDLRTKNVLIELSDNVQGHVHERLNKILKVLNPYWLKLTSFKEDQRPNRCNAASHVGAAVLAHVARSGRLYAALRRTELKGT